MCRVLWVMLPHNESLLMETTHIIWVGKLHFQTLPWNDKLCKRSAVMWPAQTTWIQKQSKNSGPFHQSCCCHYELGTKWRGYTENILFLCKHILTLLFTMWLQGFVCSNGALICTLWACSLTGTMVKSTTWWILWASITETIRDAQGSRYTLHATLGSHSSHHHTVHKEDFMKEIWALVLSSLSYVQTAVWTPWKL